MELCHYASQTQCHKTATPNVNTSMFHVTCVLLQNIRTSLLQYLLAKYVLWALANFPLQKTNWINYFTSWLIFQLVYRPSPCPNQNFWHEKGGVGLGARNFEIIEDGERVTVCNGVQSHKFVIVTVYSTGTWHALLRWMCVHTVRARARARARDHRTQQCRLACRLVVSNLQNVLMSHPGPALRLVVSNLQNVLMSHPGPALRLVVSNLQSVLTSRPCPALQWIALTWARAHAWYVLHLLRCTNRGTSSSEITNSLDAP